jgi:ferric-dicitrate binding protein FerR (iron transport regulator)
MSDAGPEHGAWQHLGELARRAASEPVSPSVHASGRMRLMMAASQRRGSQRQASWWSFSPLRTAMMAAAAAIVIGGGVLGYYAQLRPLRYEVIGGQRFATNYVGALATAPAFVKFSDGSEIDAKPGSRLRIDETHANGARVLVERGTAAARVKHRDRSRWVFAAGPFNVRVIGTKFDLDWDPQAQVVSLTLHEGAVEVESPVGQSHCIVHAGQRFQASLQTGTMTLENIEVSPASPASPLAALSAAAISSSTISTARKPVVLPPSLKLSPVSHSRERANPARWAKLVKRGEFEAVVEQALAGDLDAMLKSCTAAEARALADAARYTDRNALAERVLLTLRSRFPGTRHGDAAGFLLGRTTETTGKSDQADRWYSRYLDEAPNGEYAADALAGRMRTQLAMSGADAARPIAREYVQRFPEGVHLRMARRLLEQH